MLTKTFAAAVAISFAGLSGVAGAETVYLGGPKGITINRTSPPTVQTNKPFAQLVPSDRPDVNKHIYSGGPKSPVPHAAR